MENINNTESTINRPLDFFMYVYLYNGYKILLHEFFDIDHKEFYVINEPERYIKDEGIDQEGEYYEIYSYFKNVFRARLSSEYNKSKILLKEKFANCTTSEQIGFFCHFQLAQLSEIENKIKANPEFQDYFDLHNKIVLKLQILINKYISLISDYNTTKNKLIDNVDVNNTLKNSTSLNITDKPNSTPDESKNNISKELEGCTTEGNLTFILKMLDELSITVQGKSILGQRKKGAIRGIAEALIDSNILPQISLEITCKMIANKIGLELKSKLDYSKISDEFKKKAKHYISNNYK